MFVFGGWSSPGSLWPQKSLGKPKDTRPAIMLFRITLASKIAREGERWVWITCPKIRWLKVIPQMNFLIFFVLFKASPKIRKVFGNEWGPISQVPKPSNVRILLMIAILHLVDKSFWCKGFQSQVFIHQGCFPLSKGDRRGCRWGFFLFESLLRKTNKHPDSLTQNSALWRRLISWEKKTWHFWGSAWRIIPVSKWLVTPIYKPFRPFIRGITPFRGLTNHGY